MVSKLWEFMACTHPPEADTSELTHAGNDTRWYKFEAWSEPSITLGKVAIGWYKFVGIAFVTDYDAAKEKYCTLHGDAVFFTQKLAMMLTCARSSGAKNGKWANPVTSNMERCVRDVGVLNRSAGGGFRIVALPNPNSIKEVAFLMSASMLPILPPPL